MKRIFAVVLCLSLLALPLAALGEGDSLWGRKVKAELVTPPRAAFNKALELPRVMGISADGEKLLIVGFGGAPYLWDRGSGEKLYLTPGSEFVDGELTLICDAALARQPEGTRETLEAMYKGAPGDARLAMLMDRALNLARGFFARNASGDYMPVSNLNMPLDGLVDCRDGKWYCPEHGTPSLPVIDGRCVTYDSSKAQLWEIVSGATTEIDFGLPGWAVLCARYLPDGSICGVLQDRTAIDREKGQQNAMVILAPDGGREEYPLGKMVFPKGPDLLMAGGDGRRVVAFSATTVQRDRPYLIDRDAGTVSLLTHRPEQMRAIPLEDCLDADGAAALSEEDASCVWYPLTEMRDGTLMAIDMSLGELLLIDLRTLDTYVLLDEEALIDLAEYRMALLSTPLPLSGNGLDCFAMRAEDKYLHLTEGSGLSLGWLFGK